MPNLVERWGMSLDDLASLLEDNPSLRGMVFGYLAEVKLHEHLEASPLVTSIEKDDDHDRTRKGDRRIVYKNEEFIVEVKSLQSNSVSQLDDGTYTGKAQCDASDRRTVRLPDGSEVTTTCLQVGEFDILAINIFAFTESWRYVYAANQDLPRSKYSKYTPIQREHLLATLVDVTWPPQPPLTNDIFSLLDRLVEERSH